MEMGRLKGFVYIFNQTKKIRHFNHSHLYPQSLSILRLYSNSADSGADVRVRFAPSPTGYLHLGGLRTALYNYLFARSHGGKFILRIEDTDQARVVPDAAQKLEDDLVWAGIQPDESPSLGGEYGPYIQSKRLHLYREHTKMLLNSGAAYYCFCSDERLALVRKEALRMQAVPRYDNRCSSLEPEEVENRLQRGDPHCVRFKLHPGEVKFSDMLHGSVTLDTASIEGDPVILKSDGFPTYHLACVIDDHLMKISHVLRGVEWQISTSKHIQLHRAFGWEPPQFGHLPLLLNPDGKKLSKRQGNIHIDHFRKSGVFPEVLLSFTTEFGGGFKRDQQVKPCIYSISDLVNQFDFSLLNARSCRVEAERLVRLNRQELQERLEDPEKFQKMVEKVITLVIKHSDGMLSRESPQLQDKNVAKILRWAIPRISCVENLVDSSFLYLWIPPKPEMFLSVATGSYSLYADTLEQLIPIIERSLNTDNSTKLGKEMKAYCVTLSVDYRIVTKLLRAVLCGLNEGPPIMELIDTIGATEAVSRIQDAASTLRHHIEQN